MITGDYTQRTRMSIKGKTVTDKVVISTTGVEYVIGPRLGAGGVAKAYRAKRTRDGQMVVFKEYVPDPKRDKIHREIKKNIQKLMVQPITDDGGMPLPEIIGPLDKDSLIELPASGGFGYIMSFVDTKKYLSVPKLRHSAATLPDAKIMCKAFFNIAKAFRRVHLAGWCYKDINEGNIYIDNKTGDVRIIDCDNISVESSKTILGTNGFIAPEVYVTETPDRYSDYFSMAVLFYRILVGGFPMDGRKTKKYLMDNELSVPEAAKIIYGTEALFTFDPDDSANSIRNFTVPDKPEETSRYKIQTENWGQLPDEIQAGFTQTFSRALKAENRFKRTNDWEWMKIFEHQATVGCVKCPKCSKYTFGSPTRKCICLYCGFLVPKLKTPVPVPASINSQVTNKKTAPVKKELTTVILSVRRDIAPEHWTITAKRKQRIPGRAVYPGLTDGWMRIEYSRSRNLLSAVNLSSSPWTVSENGKKSSCAPGARVILKEGQVITVFKRQLQLKVREIK